MRWIPVESFCWSPGTIRSLNKAKVPKFKFVHYRRGYLYCVLKTTHSVYKHWLTSWICVSNQDSKHTAYCKSLTKVNVIKNIVIDLFNFQFSHSLLELLTVLFLYFFFKTQNHPLSSMIYIPASVQIDEYLLNTIQTVRYNYRNQNLGTLIVLHNSCYSVSI